MTGKKWPQLLSVGFVLGTLASSVVHGMEPRLAKIHEKIKADHESVSHIDAAAFTQLAEEDRIVFDVRKPDEFGVSHIDGAIRVSPGIEADDFIERFGDRLSGKTVVFYCSVGRRSSRLASRVNDAIKIKGAKQGYNLTGGIFNWRNESRPLVRGTQEPTTLIHPYNLFWGRLINDKSAISYAAPTDDKDPRE